MSSLICIGVAGLAIGVGSAIFGGISAKNAANAQAAQANAAGAFSDYQDKLSGLQKLTQANQIMDQANQQVTNIKNQALAVRGAVTTAQGASGAQGLVGSAAIANQVVEKGAAADVAATLGSAINKQTSEVEAGMNDFTDGNNAIMRGATQATSLEAAGSAQEEGSILSGIGNGLIGASKLGLSPSTTPSTPTTPSPSVSAGTAMSDFSTNQNTNPFAGDA